MNIQDFYRLAYNKQFSALPLLLSGSVMAAVLWWIVTLFISSAILMWLWNITITRIFNTREITFWEAFRLMIIAALLFGKGFGVNFNM